MTKRKTLGEAIYSKIESETRKRTLGACDIAKIAAAEIRRRLRAKFRKSKDSLIDVGWDTALHEAVEVTKWRKR